MKKRVILAVRLCLELGREAVIFPRPGDQRGRMEERKIRRSNASLRGGDEAIPFRSDKSYNSKLERTCGLPPEDQKSYQGTQGEVARPIRATEHHSKLRRNQRRQFWNRTRTKVSQKPDHVLLFNKSQRLPSLKKLEFLVPC
jgi:hypothetical protein